MKVHHGPLVKWLRQRPLTPLTSVRIRYGSPDFSRAKVLDKGSEIQYNTVCSPARPDDIELVLIRARVHPFPFRTRQLSSFLLTILGWRRPGKIGSANTERPHRLMWPFFVAWEASFCNIIKWSKEDFYGGPTVLSLQPVSQIPAFPLYATLKIPGDAGNSCFQAPSWFSNITPTL